MFRLVIKNLISYTSSNVWDNFRVDFVHSANRIEVIFVSASSF